MLSRAPQRQGVGTDAGEDAVQVLLSELYETSSFQGNRLGDVVLKLGTHLILNANRCVSFNIFQELGYAANHPTLYIIRASFVFRSDRHRDTSGETSDERERGQTEDSRQR